MINIWLDSSWICLIYNSYIVKMTVRNKRQVFPLCHSNSDTCQSQLQQSVFSPYVMTNASGNNWLLRSHPIGIIKVPLYFPYKRIPSILRIG